jgi:hypothetical protein
MRTFLRWRFNISDWDRDCDFHHEASFRMGGLNFDRIRDILWDCQNSESSREEVLNRAPGGIYNAPTLSMRGFVFGIGPHIFSASGRGLEGIRPRGIGRKEVWGGLGGKGALGRIIESHSVVGSGVCALVDVVSAVMIDRARFVETE